MKASEEVRYQLKPGSVYRREDLARVSNAVDRHIKELEDARILVKLAGGLYYCPKKSTFGVVPPSEQALIQTFLKDTRFLVFSRSAYNSLGVGTTQLYNEGYVYNRKRHGTFKLGNATYHFMRKPYFPSKLNQEFLLVDLVNNLKELAENYEVVLTGVARKCRQMSAEKLLEAAEAYGNVGTRKLFTHFLHGQVPHVR